MRGFAFNEWVLLNEDKLNLEWLSRNVSVDKVENSKLDRLYFQFASF